MAKRVGRPPVKDRFKTERNYLAGLIDTALAAGQRGDGTPAKNWHPWTDAEFARTLGVSSSVVGEWRNRDDPSRPVDIRPILKAFYGEITAYAGAKEAMRTAWKRSAGIEDDDPADPRQILDKPFSDVAEIAILQVNQPVPDNRGNLIVPYTLRLQCDEKVEVGIKVDGKPVTVTMDIGLTKPLVLVESKDWQPLQDTIFRKKRHPNTEPGPVGDSIWITNPKDNNGRVVGDPLEDELHVTMERRGTDSDGPILLAVKAARDGFSVTLADGPVTATQNDVLDAIFAEAIPRDARNRLEVASVVVSPTAVKTRT
jgi:hypothetical protein